MISKSVLTKACTINGLKPISPGALNSQLPLPLIEQDEKQSLSISSRSPTESPRSSPIRRKSPPKAPAQPLPKAPAQSSEIGLCPCIVTTKTKEKRVCGNKAKYNGYCGIHRVKCNLPATSTNSQVQPAGISQHINDDDDDMNDTFIPTASSKIVSQVSQQSPRKVVKRVVEVKEVEEIKSEGTCPCIIVSRQKNGGSSRICGKKVKANGRCGIHQKTCILPNIINATSKDNSNQLKKCTCIIKKTKQPCGRPVLQPTDKCARHQKTCLKMAKVEVATTGPILSPIVESKSPIDQELEDWGEQLEMEMEKEMEMETKEDITPEIQLSIQSPQLDTNWNTVQISSIDEMTKFIGNMSQSKDKDIANMLNIEDKIIRCLQIF